MVEVVDVALWALPPHALSAAQQTTAAPTDRPTLTHTYCPLWRCYASGTREAPPHRNHEADDRPRPGVTSRTSSGPGWIAAGCAMAAASDGLPGALCALRTAYAVAQPPFPPRGVCEVVCGCVATNLPPYLPLWKAMSCSQSQPSQRHL